MAEEFEILAAKVLAGEATAQETARLEELLAQDPALRAEYAEVQASWAALKELGPLAQAMDAPPAEPPPERLKQWQTEVEHKFHSPEALRADAKQDLRSAAVQTADRKHLYGPIPLALAAVLLGAAVVGSLIFWRTSRESSPTTPAAYLVSSAGTTEVHRNGKALPMFPAMPLRNGDEVKIAAGGSATVVTSNGMLSLSGPRKESVVDLASRTGTSERGWPVLAAALFGSAQQMRGLLTATRSSRDISIYSPVAFTASPTPLLLWKNEPGKTYDVTLSDELMPANPPLRLTGVTSPVEFSISWPGRGLASNGLYRLRVERTGNVLSATEVTFRTVAQPSEPLPTESRDSLLAAYKMVAASPVLIGDALAILLRLPPDLADSEMALRLKLFTFGQLGYHDEFEAVRRKLEDGK
jgi:hypothetical protein